MANNNLQDSIFWVEVEKIRPNPYQPRREFDPNSLQALSESIRQYGVLQPLLVTRFDIEREDGLAVEYELIAGERRWRAAKQAGLARVPVIIRSGEESGQMKLELAIIENLQREDLNPVERAEAFFRLANDFKYRHLDIAAKIGRSREYVSNSIRLLALPLEIIDSMRKGQITEGHGRTLLMLAEKPDHQKNLFEEVLKQNLTVREAEKTARRVAADRMRRKDPELDREVIELEEKLSAELGTRVRIESREVGGRLTIDFFSPDDLRGLLDRLSDLKTQVPQALLDHIEERRPEEDQIGEVREVEQSKPVPLENTDSDDEQGESDLYSVNNFSI